MGFEEEEIRQRAHSLIRHKLLAYDGEDTEQPRDDDLIKITPSGFIHLRSLPHFIEYLASTALHAPFSDQAVARRIGDIWGRTLKYADLSFSYKHEVASMFADYLVRTKAYLDAQNPLFKQRAREAESLVRAITGTVNATASAALRIKERNITAANEKRKEAQRNSRERHSRK
jgi:hypothetical protein